MLGRIFADSKKLDDDSRPGLDWTFQTHYLHHLRQAPTNVNGLILGPLHSFLYIAILNPCLLRVSVIHQSWLCQVWLLANASPHQTRLPQRHADLSSALCTQPHFFHPSPPFLPVFSKLLSPLWYLNLFSVTDPNPPYLIGMMQLSWKLQDERLKAPLGHFTFVVKK
jgi:hypothetical protein